MRRWQVVAGGLAPQALCVLAGAVLGLGSFTFHYAEGGSYFSNDPRACVNCHIMRDAYDGWQKASHHAVAACTGAGIIRPACRRTSVNLVTHQHVDVPFHNDREVGVVEHVFADDVQTAVDEFRAELWSSGFDARRLEL